MPSLVMICEKCGMKVPMLQQRFNIDKFMTVWVCMKCAPALQPHDGMPVRGEITAEDKEEIDRIGWEAWIEKRKAIARAKKNQKQKLKRSLLV